MALDDCGHTMHATCAVQWFRGGSQTCPLCRGEPGVIMTYLDIRTRASLLRRMARRTDAPPRLLKAVDRLRAREEERRELGTALRKIKLSPCWGIVKQYRRLLKKSHAKDAQIHVERSRLGLLECPGLPSVPFTIARGRRMQDDGADLIVD